MMQDLRRRLLSVALVGAVMAPAVYAQRPNVPPHGPPPPRPFTWWKSEPYRKELGLTTEQSDRIDKIWETSRPELRAEWDELSRLEAKLSRLIQSDAEEAVLSRQIDRVETARANANKTRSLMFVQMRKALTPDQRVRLDAIHERWLLDQQTRSQVRPPQPPRDSSKRPEH